MKTKTQDTTTPATKDITRSTAVAELKAAGYEGPVSYPMPKLRAIHAEYFASLAGETVAETAKQKKNRLARERRAAKVAA